MLRYTDSRIYVKEIPDEISLGISISGCPIHCPECHSKHIWDETKGNILTPQELYKLYYPNHRLISCVFFFGGEWDSDSLVKLINSLLVLKVSKKIGLYSGRELSWLTDNCSLLLTKLDYLKVGPYIPKYGPLNNPNTNQRMYKLIDGKPVKDITKEFQRSYL